MKSKIILHAMTAAVLSLALAACSKTSKEAPQTAEAPAAATTPADTAGGVKNLPQFDVDQAFRTQLGAVYNAYLPVKDALVASDAARVKAKTPALTQALEQVDMKLVSGAAHHDWMSYQAAMESAVKNIDAAADVEAQRTQFHTLSQNLYKTIKAYGLSGTTAYYEHCPMAFNNTGASWLSSTKEIRNPYFGDAMLTCGSVKEVLQ